MTAVGLILISFQIFCLRKVFFSFDRLQTAMVSVPLIVLKCSLSPGYKVYCSWNACPFAQKDVDPIKQKPQMTAIALFEAISIPK